MAATFPSLPIDIQFFVIEASEPFDNFPKLQLVSKAWAHHTRKLLRKRYIRPQVWLDEFTAPKDGQEMEQSPIVVHQLFYDAIQLPRIAKAFNPLLRDILPDSDNPEADETELPLADILKCKNDPIFLPADEELDSFASIPQAFTIKHRYFDIIQRIRFVEHLVTRGWDGENGYIPRISRYLPKYASELYHQLIRSEDMAAYVRSYGDEDEYNFPSIYVNIVSNKMLIDEERIVLVMHFKSSFVGPTRWYA